MGVTFGFYDSLSGDRMYNAVQISSIFDGLIADGIFENYGGTFGATVTGLDMKVTLASGRCWFDHSWLLNDGNLILTISPADATYDRIDTIVIETNSNPDVRANAIKVIEGTPASTPVPPSLINSGYVHQYPLFDIDVAALTTVIVSGDITNRIGVDTDFVVGILDTVNMANLFEVWGNEFDAWFDNLVDQLTGVQVTNLQNQINTINKSKPWQYFRNLLTNGDMQVVQRSVPATNVTAAGFYGPDRWLFEMIGSVGTWTIDRIASQSPVADQFPFSYAVSCTTAKSSLAAGDALMVSQRLEGVDIVETLKPGTSDAEDITVSFWVQATSAQTFIVELIFPQDPLGYAFSKTFTISAANTWEKVSFTFPGPSNVSAAVSPSNYNLNGLQLNIWLAAGSNFQSGTLQSTWYYSTTTPGNRAVGQYNFAGATGTNIFRFTGAQIEPGSNETEFELVPYDVALMRCMRYYQLLSNSINDVLAGPWFYASATQIDCVMYLPVEMAGVPTLDVRNGTNYWKALLGTDVFDTITINASSSTKRTAHLQGTGNVSGTAGDASSVVNNYSQAYLALDAEL